MLTIISSIRYYRILFYPTFLSYPHYPHYPQKLSTLSTFAAYSTKIYKVLLIPQMILYTQVLLYAKSIDRYQYM